jgi:hypothetical protein
VAQQRLAITHLTRDLDEALSIKKLVSELTCISQTLSQ